MVISKPSDASLGLAAQAWCEPEASHKIMDEDLCMAFARILDRVLAQSNAEPNYKEAWIKAQNRIEKLEAALAQSDAEPVTNPGTAPDLDELVMLTQEFKGYSLLALMQEAHNLRAAQSDAGRRLPFGWNDPFHDNYLGEDVVAANSASPCPDVSAGLIEAAELAERNADKGGSTGPNALRHLAKTLRARAADRSEK